MTEVDVAAWADWHAVNAPWCDWRRCGSHTVRLNGPDLVNGRPAGPQAELTVPALAAAARGRRLERQARFAQQVAELLEAAGPAAFGR